MHANQNIKFAHNQRERDRKRNRRKGERQKEKTRRKLITSRNKQKAVK